MSNEFELPDSVAQGETPDIVRQAITEHPKEAAEFLSAHFPAVNAYEELRYRRQHALDALRTEVENLTENVKYQASLARKNTRLVASMIEEGEFDDLAPGVKQEAIVDLMICAEQLDAAAKDAKDASNAILGRNKEVS